MVEAGIYQVGTMTGSELREIRKALKLTQSQLGDLFEIHPITISDYETGHAKIPKAVEMAAKWLIRDAER